MTLDLLFALLIGMSLMSALAIGAWHYHRGIRRVEHQREAVRLVEQAMVQLQTMGNISLDPSQAQCVIELLEDDAPAGCRWVRLKLHYIDTNAQLIGLVSAAVAQRSEP